MHRNSCTVHLQPKKIDRNKERIIQIVVLTAIATTVLGERDNGYYDGVF